MAATIEQASARAAGPPIPGFIRRNLLFIAAAQLSAGTANQLTPTLGAVMTVHLSGSTSLAGFATGLFGLGRMLVAYPIGSLADRHGRKAALFLGIGIGLLGAMLVGSSVLLFSLPLFFAGIITFGLGAGAVQQLRVAAADMLPPDRRAEGLGLLLTGSLLGAFGGFGLVSTADFLTGPIGIEPLALVWFLTPAVFLLAAAFITRVRPDPREIAGNLESYYPGYRASREQGAARGQAAADASFWSFVNDYPKLTAFVSYFAVQGNMSMMMAMTSLLLRHTGHSLPEISLSVAIHIVGMFGFSLPLGRLTDRVGRRWVMLLGVIIAGGGSLLVVATSHYWVITAGLFLVGVGWSAVNIAAVALIADRTSPLVRGRAVGTNDTFGGAASTSMPILAGPIAALFGLGVIGILGMLVMIGPLLLLLRLREPAPGRYGRARPLESPLAP